MGPNSTESTERSCSGTFTSAMRAPYVAQVAFSPVTITEYWPGGTSPTATLPAAQGASAEAVGVWSPKLDSSARTVSSPLLSQSPAPIRQGMVTVTGAGVSQAGAAMSTNAQARARVEVRERTCAR